MSEFSVYDELEKRGYIAQTNKSPTEMREYLAEPGKVFYTGYDPTAGSLHVGHLCPLMVMAWLQKAGHIPIPLMGGGTGMIGDPSGRTDMRRILSNEQKEANVAAIAKQMELLLDLSEGKAYLDNNENWIKELGFIDFLREYGTCFSVNRMLAAECYKARLSEGLTFLEFSYMLLQAYDFLTLYRKYNCTMQLGGDDQWSNMLAGSDLIRRKEGANAYVMTFNLLTTADGNKMGKSADGAVWLDKEMLPIFDFYQYFRNVDDRDVIKLMKILTFVPLEQINEFALCKGSALNPVKERLAFEVTSLVHGREAAVKAAERAKELFRGKDASSLPGIEISVDDIYAKDLITLMRDHDIVSSKSEGRRLIIQGGIQINDQVADTPDVSLKESDFESGAAVIRRGKKHHYKFVLKDQ